MLYKWVPFLLFFAAIAPSRALATTVLAVSDHKLVHQADTVALGHVIRKRVEIDKRLGTQTYLEMQVYDAVKGTQPGNTLTLAFPGGVRPDGLVAQVAGAPTLKEGDLALVFLENKGGVMRPLGMSFGVWDVQSVGGAMRVFRDLQGLSLVGDPADLKETQDTLELGGEPLSKTLTRLRDLLKQPLPTPRSTEVKP